MILHKSAANLRQPPPRVPLTPTQVRLVWERADDAPRFTCAVCTTDWPGTMLAGHSGRNCVCHFCVAEPCPNPTPTPLRKHTTNSTL